MSRGFSHLVAAAVPLLWLAVVAPSQEGALAIGNGSTSQAPIVIAGTSNIIEGIAAEARWISQRYAEERVRSVTIGRAKINMAAVTEVGLVSKDARQRRIYFVIDESSFKHSGIDILWKSYVHAIRDATDSTLLGAYSKQIRQALTSLLKAWEARRLPGQCSLSMLEVRLALTTLRLTITIKQSMISRNGGNTPAPLNCPRMNFDGVMVRNDYSHLLYVCVFLLRDP